MRALPRFAHHRSRAHNCQVKSSFQRVVDSVRRRWRRRRRAVDEFVWFHVTSSRPRRRPRRRRRRRRRRHNHVVRPTASDGCVGHRRDDRARDNRATVVVRASRRLNHTLCAHKPNRAWKRWILNFELKTKAVQRPVVTGRVPPLTTLSEVCTSPRHDRGTPMGMRMRAARGVRFCRSSCRSLFRRPTNSDAPASPPRARRRPSAPFRASCVRLLRPRTSRTWESVT